MARPWKEGPDAYLNLPHISSSSSAAGAAAPTGTNAGHVPKWLPSRNNFSILNLSAQHNVHVIHQRLQELKNSKKPSVVSNSNTDSDSNSSFSTSASQQNSSTKMTEKPQLDLNEFLQQLGVLKEEDRAENEESLIPLLPEEPADAEQERRSVATEEDEIGFDHSDDFNGDPLAGDASVGGLRGDCGRKWWWGGGGGGCA